MLTFSILFRCIHLSGKRVTKTRASAEQPRFFLSLRERRANAGSPRLPFSPAFEGGDGGGGSGGGGGGGEGGYILMTGPLL